jgi:hypothetical protein
MSCDGNGPRIAGACLKPIDKIHHAIKIDSKAGYNTGDQGQFS